MISYIQLENETLVEFTAEPKRELYFAASGRNKLHARENMKAKIQAKIDEKNKELNALRQAVEAAGRRQ